MDKANETVALVGLDTNMIACVLAHLSPADLARVGQTCRVLGREAASDLVWCALFLRRFGSDFWGEAVGQHPYLPTTDGSAAPADNDVNPWRNQRHASELYALFAARTSKKPASDCSDDEDDADGLVPRLLDFVQQNAAPSAGYGGWKLAYRRMHEMVAAWTLPADEGLLVAGLVPFDTLCIVANNIKRALLLGLGDKPKGLPANSDPPVGPPFDMRSPGGECRILRVEGYHNIYYSSRKGQTTTNICVVRKPRNWYGGGNPFFRGLRTTLSSDMKIVYVVDAKKMSSSEAQAERVYRELHGMLGEGKDRFEEGLSVVLFVVNATDDDHVRAIYQRLKIPEVIVPLHWCPYYAGPVVFIIASFYPAKVGPAMKWLLKQPSMRPHWDSKDFFLCALQAPSD